MHFLRKLVREVHRRSIWQVIGIYLAGSWGVLQVVDYMTQFAGLPEWTPSMAFVLLLIGLPITVATAFIQAGIPGLTDDPNDEIDPNELEGLTPEEVHRNPAAHPLANVGLFTWRNAVLGGIGAAVLLFGSVAAYLVMWTLGIGPVGNLVAQGLIAEGAPVLLAEFENTSSDPSLGGMVTEALRVDLSSAQTIVLLEPARVREILGLMDEAPGEPVRGELAREVAVRGGVKAIIEGEVGSAGSGYILVATIRGTESGTTLATFRRTASGPDDVISAIDDLSQDIREKAGEPLRLLRAEEPLQDVTTASLDALRKFTEAETLEENGEHARAKALLEEAIALDPEFAMAWRKLAVVIQDAGGTRDEEIAAATRAYELRHRLTERERYQAIAYYHQAVTLDVPGRIGAYRNILDRYPDDRSALNNLSIVYGELTRWDQAVELLERAVSGPGTSAPAWTNLVSYRALAGDFQGSEEALAAIKERYPARALWLTFIEYVLAFSMGDAERAAQMSAVMESLPDAPASWRSGGIRQSGRAAVLVGHMAEGRSEFQRALRTSRADRRWSDAVSASLSLAEAERLAGTDRDRAVLQEMLASGDLAELSGPARDYPSVVYSLALSGMGAEAHRLLNEWAAEGGPTASGPNYDFVRQMTEAVLLGLDDPGAGADALLTLRIQRDCPRCAGWRLGNLLTEAGRLDEATAERQSSLDVAEDFWFGLHRMMAHEKLGQLYEAQGDNARAAEQYAAFAEMWADADAELQPRVREARSKAAALRGDG